MKRIDTLTDRYLKIYMDQTENDKFAYDNNGWPPVIFFRDNDSGLRKISITVPRSYVKKNGCVSVARIKNRLRAAVRQRIVESLGYACGYDIYGEWTVFYKRDTPKYFGHEYRLELASLFKNKKAA